MDGSTRTRVADVRLGCLKEEKLEEEYYKMVVLLSNFSTILALVTIVENVIHRCRVIMYIF